MAPVQHDLLGRAPREGRIGEALTGLDAVVLVVAFGAGMAPALTGVGVVTIRGYALSRLRTRSWSAASAVVAWTPTVAGVAVAVGGCLYLLVAITTLAAQAGLRIGG